MELVTTIPVIGRRLLYLMRRILPFWGHPGAADVAQVEFQEKSLYIYAYNLFLAQTLCEKFGAKFYHFLQPLLHRTKKPMTENEKFFVERGVSATGDMPILETFFSKFEAQDFEGSHFLKDMHTTSLKDVFDDCEKEAYVDIGHLKGEGNTIVAQAIAQKILGKTT